MKLLLTYLLFLIPGQILAGLAGVFFDQFSKAIGITVFIVLYYTMFWLAWRLTLMIIDKPARSESPSRAAAASIILAPALLAFELAE